MRRNITEEEFFRRVASAGGRAYIVGGAVRDMLLRRPLHDRDYVVCGLTEQSFSKLFNKPPKVGRSFPVFLLDIDGNRCEVAFARREVKHGTGYKGFTVDFTPSISIEDDLYRRDLTINAMARDAEGRLIDPYGGAKDIEERRIRAVSEHFSEDPLRALRAARFAAQFEFTIDEETKKLARACGPELIQEPAERKLVELRKALSLDRPSLYFRNLLDIGLLEQEFPWIYRLIGQTQPEHYHPEGDAFEHSMQILDKVSENTDTIEARFAALMHDIGKGVTPKELLPRHHGHDKAGLEILPEITKSLKLPVRWTKSAEFVIREHMRIKRLSGYGKMRDVLYEMYKGPLSPEDFAVIVRADSKGHYNPFVEEHEMCWAAIREAGKRTAAESRLTGPELGKCIRSREAEALKRELLRIERKRDSVLEEETAQEERER